MFKCESLINVVSLILTIILILSYSLSPVLSQSSSSELVITNRPYVKPYSGGTELFLSVFKGAEQGILKITYSVSDNKTAEEFLQTTDKPVSQPHVITSEGYERVYVIEQSSTTYILRSYNMQYKTKIVSNQLTYIWSQPIGVTGFHLNNYDYVIIYSNDTIVIYRIDYSKGNITEIWPTDSTLLPEGIKVGGGAKEIINVGNRRLFIFAGVKSTEWYLLALDLTNPDSIGDAKILIKGLGGEPIGYDLFSYQGKKYLAVTWTDSLYIYCFENNTYYKWTISPSLELVTRPSHILVSENNGKNTKPLVVVGDNKGTIHLISLSNNQLVEVKQYNIASLSIVDLYVQMSSLQKTFWILFVILSNGDVEMLKVPVHDSSPPSLIMSKRIAGEKYYGVFPRMPGTGNVVYIISDKEIIRISTNFGAPEKSVLSVIISSSKVTSTNTGQESSAPALSPVYIGLGIGIIAVAVIGAVIVFRKFLGKGGKEKEFEIEKSEEEKEESIEEEFSGEEESLFEEESGEESSSITDENEESDLWK